MMPSSSAVSAPPREKKSRWLVKQLADVCEVFADGDWVESKDQSPAGIRLIQTGNVGEGFFKDRAEKARYISEATFKRLRCTEIFEGDCLISRLPDPVGRSCILPETGERMITAVDCTIVRFKPNQLLPGFFNYFSQSDDYLGTVAKECTGTTRNRISRSNLGLTPIPVPPLAEQQRIVGILDEACGGLATAKANAQKNVQNARALFENHLQSVFTQRGEGWKEKPLSAVCDLQNGYAFKSGDYIKSSNTLNIRMSSIRPGGSFDPEHNQRFLPDSYAKDYASFLLEDGDLIIAMTDMAGDPKILGVPTLVSNQNGRNFLTNQRVGKLFGFSDNVRVPFLRYFLTTPSIKLFYKSKGAGGLQINISKGDILSAQIPLPPINVQDHIVGQLDELSEEALRLASIYERKLAALEVLKQSLLHQAFTGQL
jgi:type I restriction enzyme S subunit